MNSTIRLALLSSALASVAISAVAADLPTRKEPPPMAAPAFTWAGSYLGANLGYGFGQNDPMLAAAVYSNALGKGFFPIGNRLAFPLAYRGNENVSGILGGVQAGHNFQISPMFVIGAELDFQGAGISGGSSSGGTVAGFPVGFAFPSTLFVGHSQRVSTFGTVRGRIGFAPPGAPNLLIYATGGLAYGQVQQTLSATQTFTSPSTVSALTVAGGRVSGSALRTGYALGGGVEWAPLSLQRWSFKLEYLYTDLGRSYLAIGPYNTTFDAFGSVNFFSTLARSSAATRFHTVRLGVNYRFGSVGADPVVAKY